MTGSWPASYSLPSYCKSVGVSTLSTICPPSFSHTSLVLEAHKLVLLVEPSCTKITRLMKKTQHVHHHDMSACQPECQAATEWDSHGCLITTTALHRISHSKAISVASFELPNLQKCFLVSWKGQSISSSENNLPILFIVLLVGSNI